MSKSFSDMLNQYEGNKYAFSGFLGSMEISKFWTFIKDYNDIPFELFGGKEDCERLILRFGNEETLGYSEDFPISALQISPKSKKFADEFTHRDFLGAIINLGIERSTVGDIYISENRGYVFCLNTMADYICENLTKIKHTAVECKKIEEIPKLKEEEPKKKLVQVSSLRLDGIIARTYNLSRTDALVLFTTHKVFVDGRLCENNSYQLRPENLVSVRGYGRLKISSVGSLSKKGKQNLTMLVW